jgi:3'-5' exoribonuclease
MPPISKDELVNRFNKMADSIKNSDCKKLLEYFLKKYGDKFFDAPAAASVHHEFSSGLLMHSICIAEICDYLASFYKDVNRDLLVTGAILHDFGKMEELEGPAVFHYTVEGKLLGHISIMAAEVREASKKLEIKSEIPTLLEHMILSHHGQLEFGSPVLPLTREALILSIVDSLDSKMLILDKAYEDVKKGEFTNKIFPLDNRAFYKAK